jgi:hypothetical protein
LPLCLASIQSIRHHLNKVQVGLFLGMCG